MLNGPVLQGGDGLLIVNGKLCLLQLGVKKMRGKFSSLPRVGLMVVMERTRLDSLRCLEVTMILDGVLCPLQIWLALLKFFGVLTMNFNVIPIISTISRIDWLWKISLMKPPYIAVVVHLIIGIMSAVFAANAKTNEIQTSLLRLHHAKVNQRTIANTAR